MTDIEKLRQNVIDAAHKVVRTWKTSGMHSDGKLLIDEQAVLDCINALDAAERPDPWKLLAELIDPLAKDTDKVRMEARAALKWREQNPDD